MKRTKPPIKIKKYESFGGGVNSVAMKLLCLEWEWDTETIFVDHQTDWPETYEYLDMFQEWLDKKGFKPTIVLKPEYKGYDNLYDYYFKYRMVTSFMRRFCTYNFKLLPIWKYCQTPCFMLIGFDCGEQCRAKLSTQDGIENRFPLIEAELDREGCKSLIKKHGLPVPMKSGCYICPFQSAQQFRQLWERHPDLFQRALEMENQNIEYRKEKGKKPLSLCAWPKIPLMRLIGEDWPLLKDEVRKLKEGEYKRPHCICEL